jgi:hypothetical protein
MAVAGSGLVSFWRQSGHCWSHCGWAGRFQIQLRSGSLSARAISMPTDDPVRTMAKWRA